MNPRTDYGVLLKKGSLRDSLTFRNSPNGRNIFRVPFVVLNRQNSPLRVWLMGAKKLYNFEHLKNWREKGGSVEKAELHARLMTALIVRKDKLTVRQLHRVCTALVPGPYERTVALLAGVSEAATVDQLQAALNVIEAPNVRRTKRPQPDEPSRG